MKLPESAARHRGASIYTVGLPEELAKAIPVLAVALIGYAKAGSGGGPHAAADAMLPALSGSRTPRPWWEH